MTLLLTYWKQIALALVILLAFWNGYDYGSDRVQARWDRAKREALELSLAKSQELEDALAKQRAEFLNIEKRLKDELKNKVYADCVVTPDGVQLFNDAWKSPR